MALEGQAGFRAKVIALWRAMTDADGALIYAAGNVVYKDWRVLDDEQVQAARRPIAIVTNGALDLTPIGFPREVGEGTQQVVVEDAFPMDRLDEHDAHSAAVQDYLMTHLDELAGPLAPVPVARVGPESDATSRPIAADRFWIFTRYILSRQEG